MLRFMKVLFVALAFAATVQADPLPKEVIDAVGRLPGSNEAGRQQIYGVLAEKGDARLIPLLEAYRDGSLQNREGKFIVYGKRVNFPGQGSMLPLLDAITGNPILGSDGKPSGVLKPDLSKAINAPPRPQRRAILDLISSLSLLAPDPETRLQSIRDAGERANRAFLKSADHAQVMEDLAKTAPALSRQLDKDPQGHFAPALREAVASIDLATGDHAAQLKAAVSLGNIGSSRAANILKKWLDASHDKGDHDAEQIAQTAIAKTESYQSRVQIAQYTFAGISQGSILVLLALGLSVIFGLMGVINMAHGEFMMIGAFTTYLVSEGFKHLPPAWYNYYLIAAIPAAFLVAGLIGFVCEATIIRHLYGRPLETLLATFGLGLILVQTARSLFGNNRSVKPPTWMEGGVEVATDLVFPLNRVYILIFCILCIAAANWIVNRTKFGLILRATTQNREMAAALGVATRRIDGLTFALGCGLAGLAGVAVPLYDKINPAMGSDYIVDSFLVVVVGGVGKLAGAVIAGFGLGFIGKYLEPLFQHVSFLKSGASVIGKVAVLGMVIIFLQYKPSGLFPPKGRNADA